MGETTWVHHVPTGLKEPVGELRLEAIEAADTAEEWEILGPSPVPPADWTWTIEEREDGFHIAPEAFNSPYTTEDGARRAIRSRYPDAVIAEAASVEVGMTGEDLGAQGPEAETTGGEASVDIIE